MKKACFILFTAIFIMPFFNINAQVENLGLGFMVGRPTGISGNYWINNKNSIDFGLGYSLFSSNASVSLHADYLYHRKDAIKNYNNLDIYYGVGGRFKAEKHEKGSLGVRGVAGVRTELEKMPLDLFFEIAPVFKLFPKTAVGLDIAIGGRYYFK